MTPPADRRAWHRARRPVVAGPSPRGPGSPAAPPPRHRAIVAVVLLLLALAGLGAALHGRPDPPAGAAVIAAVLPAGTPAGSPRRAPAGSADATTTGAPASSGSLGAVPDRSVPVGLRIPALDLAAPLSQLGLNPDGTVEVPADHQQPGWFRLGPTPGQVGSSVILGHVDSYRGPAVFFRLGTLRPGDRIEVSLADGAVARFRVRAVETYLKRDFPARRVYASHGDRALNLVTCGGEFDSRTRSYLSNVVVYTSLVGATVTGPGAGRPRAGRAPR